MLVLNIESDFTFENFLKFRYKETYRTITSGNLEYFLTNSLLWCSGNTGLPREPKITFFDAP